MAVNYVELTGTNYQIGYKAGYWWAEYFLKHRNAPAVKAFLRWCNYIYYFRDSWDLRNDIHKPLLDNTMNWYPEVIEEVAGMEKGVSDAFHKQRTLINVSFLDMFCLMLGETYDLDYNCSSAVLRTPTGYMLAHNDEYTARYPILVAKVHVKRNRSVARFISVSYPFQLLGSSAGMNGFLAFSGNSIGCKKQLHVLRSTWMYRVPLAIFPRKLLEAKTIDDVKDLFSQHHTTLPSHHYVAFKDKAYSVQIRPLLLSSHNPSNQVLVKKIGGDLHCHTNHFLSGKGFDSDWTYNRPGRIESIKRYQYLSEVLKSQAAPDEPHVKKVFLDMAQDPRFRKQTAATYFFKVAEKRSSFEGHFYFAAGFKKNVFLNHDGASSI